MTLEIFITLAFLFGIALGLLAARNDRQIDPINKRYARAKAELDDCDQGGDVYRDNLIKARRETKTAETVTIFPTPGKVIVKIGNRIYSGASTAEVTELINGDDRSPYLAVVDKGKLEIADPGTGEYLQTEIA